MADTRTERKMRTARHVAPARIMSDAQMAKLLEWLGDEGHKDMPKIVATPSILLPRHARALQGNKVVARCVPTAGTAIRIRCVRC